MRPIFPLMKLEAHERVTFGDVDSKVDLSFNDRMNENASFYFSLPKHLPCCLDASKNLSSVRLLFDIIIEKEFKSFYSK